MSEMSVDFMCFEIQIHSYVMLNIYTERIFTPIMYLFIINVL